jgi:hypothetical protein
MEISDEGAEEDGSKWTNPYARVLMTEIDLESDAWGTTPHRWDLDNSILLLCESGEDMDLTVAKRICFYCLEVLEPLLRRVLAGEISRQSVLQEITVEKVRTWKPGEHLDEAGSETRPRSGFVSQIGSARWEYEKQNSRILAVTDTILRQRGRV